MSTASQHFNTWMSIPRTAMSSSVGITVSDSYPFRVVAVDEKFGHAIRVGDEVEKVASIHLQAQMSQDQVRAMLSGPPGSFVEIQFKEQPVPRTTLGRYRVVLKCREPLATMEVPALHAVCNDRREENSTEEDSAQSIADQMAAAIAAVNQLIDTERSMEHAATEQMKQEMIVCSTLNMFCFNTVLAFSQWKPRSR